MKRWIAVLLSVCMLGCCFSANAFADEATPGGVIEARFSDFGNVYATMTYNSSTGICHMEGGAATYNGKNWVELTLTVERYISGSGYQPVDGLSWSASDSVGTGTQADRDLPSGTYRAHTVASCYRDGKLLETVEAYSRIVEVP